MNKKENTIPKGYKLSPLGPIPNDWEVSNSSKAIKYYGGNAFSSDDSLEKGIRWLKIANVGVERVKWDDESFLPVHYADEYTKYLLKEGDVVMALTRPILDDKLKIATVSKDDIPALLNQRVAKLIVKTGHHLPFLYYALQQPHFVHSMNASMAGTDPPNIGNGELEKIKIHLPPIEEQTAIANLLSTWDRAITHTTQLIAQKELRKKWLMQQLLTGKKRLPAFAKATAGKKGFKERFREYRINQLFEMIDRYVEWNDSELYKLVSIRRRFGGLFYRGDLLGEQIGVKTLKSVYNDDFLISKRQVAHGAWAVVTKEFHDAKVSDEYDSLIVKDNEKLNSSFWSWYCQQPIMRHYAFLDSVGVHIEKLIFDYNQFKKRKVLIPGTIEEQTAIASVLQSADAELNLLRQKLDKLKEQKKGLMQVLLTGKKRLNV